MSIPYFYEPTIVAGHTSFTLNETSSKHCVQVLRMKENDRVDITNGKGFLFEAVIINAHKKKYPCTPTIRKIYKSACTKNKCRN